MLFTAMEVVALIQKSGRSIGEVARELDIADSVVRNWVRDGHMIRDDGFYMCTRPPHFQSYLPDADLSDDGIGLHDGPGLVERLRAYLLREQPLEACFHCHGGRAAMVPHRLLSRSELVRARR